MPKGYWIPHLDVSNPQGFEAYRQTADAWHRTNGSNGSSTHHPVSRVRYRGADDSDRFTEYRTRPRRRHSWDDYDSER